PAAFRIRYAPSCAFPCESSRSTVLVSFRPMDLMRQRKPEWLRAKLAESNGYHSTRSTIEGNAHNTVCESARCPNRGECWSRGTATVMILGNVCTRSCTFCNIDTGRPQGVDLFEPARTAEAIYKMKLRHAVKGATAGADVAE